MKLKSIVTIFSIIYLIATLPTFAQQAPAIFSVKGTITDSLSKKPSDFVTVSLRNAERQVVRTAATKEDGIFAFEKLVSGKYTITLTSLEYTLKTVAVDLTDNTKPAIDLGIILIAPKFNQLQAVVVMADKPIIKQEVDRLTYDLQADPESKSNSVFEMMRKVPLLTIDGEDNVLLNGSKGYKILINGKPSGMMELDAKSILKSMPASTIQSIEVITNPPAKYDAEGIAGIINIVTIKKADNGYNGTLNANHRFPAGGPGAGSSISYKQGKFGISAFSGANLSNSPETRNSISRQTTGITSTSLAQSNSSASDSKSAYLGTELSYEIDSLNLISGQFNINGNNSDGISKQNSVINGTGGIMQQYDLLNNNGANGRGLDAALNYQRGFKNNKARLLTFSYRFYTFNNEQHSNLGVFNSMQYTTPDYRQVNESKSAEQTFQIDYVHPAKSLTIEAGFKGILRQNNSDFQYRFLNSTSGQFELDPTRSNTYDNSQNVFGAYNSYQFSLKNWEFKAGARIEETIISSESSIKQDYFNVIPTLNINRLLKNRSSLNLAYSVRIQRPGIYQLNPFVDRSNPNFESAGNPVLRPSIGQDIRLSFNKSKKASLNTSVRYQYIETMITPTSAFDPITNTTRSSFGNTGKARLIGYYINLNYPINNLWRMSIDGRISHGRMSGLVNGIPVMNQRIMYGASASSNYRFGAGWNLSANAYMNGPGLTIQGSGNAFATVSFSANKDIVKDKLTFAATINNPFNKYRTNRLNSFGPDFTQSNLNQMYFRGFTASLNYRFGKLKAAIEKNKRGIRNDDVQQ